MEAESEYLQIRPSATFGTSVRQLEKERITDKVQAAQTKSSELELLFHALRCLTLKVEGLEETQITTVTEERRCLWEVCEEGTLLEELQDSY